LECGSRSYRFAVREPQLALPSARHRHRHRRELRLAHGKAATAVAALHMSRIEHPFLCGCAMVRMQREAA